MCVLVIPKQTLEETNYKKCPHEKAPNVSKIALLCFQPLLPVFLVFPYSHVYYFVDLNVFLVS